MKKLLIFLIAAAVSASCLSAAGAFEEVGSRPSRHPQVEVWLNKHNGSVYHPGQIVRTYFQTNSDCYVAVYNIDAEGFVHVLYPKYDDRAWVEGGRIYEIPDPYDNYDLVVDGPKGIEYVVAVASEFPLNLRAIFDIEDGVDDYYWPMGRVTGDPHLAIHDINERLAWGNEEYEPEGYSSDASWFYVREWVPYPRYIVYHWYPEYIYDPWWDPYIHVNIWLDFYWDHYWCRPWWWCRGCQPIYVYWYIDRDSGRRVTWKGDYHTDRRKPDWYREKPIRRSGGVERPSRDNEGQDGRWEDRRRSPWGDPGTDANEIRTRAQGREPVDLERKQREVRRDDVEKTTLERDSRSRTTRVEKETGSSSRSRQEIRRTPKPSTEQRSRDNIQQRSTRSSETKKVEKRSSKGSTLGKIFGGVAKIFSRDSKKESSSSSKKSKSSDSSSSRSKKSSSNDRSSKSSSAEEKKSR